MHQVQRGTVSHPTFGSDEVGPTTGLADALGFKTEHRHGCHTWRTVTLPSASASTITKG